MGSAGFGSRSQTRAQRWTAALQQVAVVSRWSGPKLPFHSEASLVELSKTTMEDRKVGFLRCI